MYLGTAITLTGKMKGITKIKDKIMAKAKNIKKLERKKLVEKAFKRWSSVCGGMFTSYTQRFDLKSTDTASFKTTLAQPCGTDIESTRAAILAMSEYKRADKVLYICQMVTLMRREGMEIHKPRYKM